MKVYRRELEEDGVVVDPLKASYTAKVSASQPNNIAYTVALVIQCWYYGSSV